MKRNLPALSIALACALGYQGDATADDITIDHSPFVSSASRNDVLADLHAYKLAGVNPWSMGYNPLRSFRSTRTRAEVTAEYLHDRRAVAAMHGEDSGSGWLAQIRTAPVTSAHMAISPARNSRAEPQGASVIVH